MTATRRRQVGAHTLAVLGIFALLAAFIPGIAGAVQPEDTGSNTCKDQPLFGAGDPGVHTDGDINLSGDTSGDWGSLTWIANGSDGKVQIDSINEGYTVYLCLKKGSGEGSIEYAGPFDDETELPVTVAFSSDQFMSHFALRWVLDTPEVDTYLVIPEKTWVGIEGEGDGFAATITITPDDATPAESWTFDEEGTRDNDDPIEIPVGVGYTWSEEFTAPTGWECEAEEAAVAVLVEVDVDVLDIVNTCEEDDTPPPPPPPPPVITGDTPPPAVVPEVIPGEVQAEVVEVVEVQAEVAEAAAAPATLPRTGAGVAGLVALGLSALMGGLGLNRFSRREDAQA